MGLRENVLYIIWIIIRGWVSWWYKTQHIQYNYDKGDKCEDYDNNNNVDNYHVDHLANIIIIFFTFIVIASIHDDVIKWKHFPRYWTFIRGIHRSPVNSPHKGQWRWALMFSFIYTWINGWVNQSWGWWFETPSYPLWRHCNASAAVIAATIKSPSSPSSLSSSWSPFLPCP